MFGTIPFTCVNILLSQIFCVYEKAPKKKRKQLSAVINYIEKRTQWMNYGELQKQDLYLLIDPGNSNTRLDCEAA